MKKSLIIAAFLAALGTIGALRAAQPTPAKVPAACCDGGACCHGGACCAAK